MASKKKTKSAAEAEVPAAGTPKHGRHPIWAISLFIVAIALACALFSFDLHQEFWALSSWQRDTTNSGGNAIGAIGATFAVWAFAIFGAAAFLIPVFVLFWTLYMMRLRENFSPIWKIIEMLLAMICAAIFLTAFPQDWLGIDPKFPLPSMHQGAGGFLGTELFKILEPAIGGNTILFVSLGIFLVLFCSICLTSLTRVICGIWRFFAREMEKSRERKKQREAIAEMEENERRQRILEEDERRRQLQDLYGADADAPTADDVTRDHEPEAVPAGSENSEISEHSEISENSENSDVPAKVAGTLVVEDDGDDDDDEAVPASHTGDEDVAAPTGATSQETNPVPANPASSMKIADAGTLERAETVEPEPHGEYVFPPLDLLKAPPPHDDVSADVHLARGNEIIRVLKEFNCEAELQTAQVGPTVTRYEIRLASGINPNKVMNLGTSLAMGIRAKSARIMPIPENGTVGIEVPNAKRETVYIREILESQAWVGNKKMALPAVLGKNVTGQPVIMDLAKMPHGLIAGTSGSGKSVCLNGIVTSLLYKIPPSDLKLMMVDPKVVELKVYNNAPHMLIPVITDMKRAPGAIKYLIDEMERRYKLLEEAGVRNIAGFNEKVERLKAEGIGVPAAGTITVERDEGVDNEFVARKKLPYIVAIIDEFADIMAGTQRAEVENGVARLTAKSRAAGIHLILATQRPDAKTVTGLIKSNLGTRIALRVTSGINSNIILDTGGAETLIGYGDMLVLRPSSPDLERAQGVWVDEEEIEKVVNFLAEKNGPPQFSDDVTSIIDGYTDEAEGAEAGGNDVASGLTGDEALAARAWDIILKSKRPTISYLQMRLGIGYGKAARIINALEMNSYIGPADPNDPKSKREILKDRWDGINMSL